MSRSQVEIEYKDESGNLWRVQAAGDEELVKGFAGRQALILSARPLTPDDQERLKGFQCEEGEPETPTDPPALDVTISLLELAVQFPYLISFAIDPSLPSGNHLYSFRLVGADTTANVRGRANMGTIKLSLTVAGRACTRGPGADLQASIAGVPKSSSCSIRVYWASGSPRYSLSGDITVAA